MEDAPPNPGPVAAEDDPPFAEGFGVLRAAQQDPGPGLRLWVPGRLQQVRVLEVDRVWLQAGPHGVGPGLQVAVAHEDACARGLLRERAHARAARARGFHREGLGVFAREAQLGFGEGVAGGVVDQGFHEALLALVGEDQRQLAGDLDAGTQPLGRAHGDADLGAQAWIRRAVDDEAVVHREVGGAVKAGGARARERAVGRLPHQRVAGQPLGHQLQGAARLDLRRLGGYAQAHARRGTTRQDQQRQQHPQTQPHTGLRVFRSLRDGAQRPQRSKKTTVAGQSEKMA